MIRRGSVAVAGLATLSLLIAGPAAAHSGNPNVDTLITGTSPSLSGVTITAIQSSIAPALSAVNDSAASLQILGPDGFPFLRIGPDGAFGNVDSPAFYLSQAPSGETSVPTGIAKLRGHEHWVRLSRKPAWAWYDARIPDIATPPPAAGNRAAPTRLSTFTIPLRYGGRAAKALGEVDYRPPRGGAVATMTSPMRIAPGVTVALLPGSDPDVYVQDSGTRTVTVEGQQGEPFAQIGPHGVRVNVLSPIHEADVIARGGSAKVRLEGSHPPVWRHVSTAPTYDWLDPRPRFEPKWKIPLLIGGRAYDITGVLDYKPATTVAALLQHARQPARRPQRAGGGSGSAWAIAIGAVVVAALLAGGIALARRRRRV